MKKDELLNEGLYDIVMMDKVQKLWDAGHQEELAYFGQKCSEATVEGIKRGIKANLIFGVVVGLAGAAFVSYSKHKNNKVKKDEDSHDEEIQTEDN